MSCSFLNVRFLYCQCHWIFLEISFCTALGDTWIWAKTVTFLPKHPSIPVTFIWEFNPRIKWNSTPLGARFTAHMLRILS